MKIVQCVCDLKAGENLFKADVPYVGSDNAASGLVSSAPRIARVVADAAPFVRHYRGQELAGKRLLIYRCLGIGDEFMAARLADVVAGRNPTASVTLAIFDTHHAMWSGKLPGFNLAGPYIPLSVWEDYDFHIAGEHWWESNAMADQPSAWEIMQRATGISLDPSECLPLIPLPGSAAIELASNFLGHWLKGQDPIILWQVAATSNIRSYPPENTQKAMELILAKTGANIIMAGHPGQIALYPAPDDARIKLYADGIEGLIALCRALSGSKTVVVCPDSVLGHIATAYPAIPVISLWSSFTPQDRVATYPNHRPIYNPVKCSPCRSHEQSGNPKNYTGCPFTACKDYCAGLRGIAPERILAAIKEVI